MKFLEFFKFWRFLYSGSINPADKAALESFLHNFYWGEGLPDSEAKHNLEQGVVELIDKRGNHIANGLLITTNGYLVTSYHCVDDVGTRTINVRCSDDRIYPLKKVLRYNEQSDIALAKAEIPTNGSTQALRYRFKDQSKFRELPLIVHLGRRNGKLVQKGGHLYTLDTLAVTHQNGEVTDGQILASINAAPGDSGGVITTLKYQICGVHHGGWRKAKHGSCTFFYKALELISSFTHTTK
jgi:S1-C subfamily serine protease